MTTTSIHPSIIVMAFLIALLFFIHAYLISDRELWDALLYGSGVILWSGWLIGFIFEQWIR